MTSSEPIPSLSERLHAAATELLTANASGDLDEARLEVELLYGEAAGLTRVQVIAGSREPAAAEHLAGFEALLERRRGREPLAYILGRREFYGLTFEVGPGALIPRPETETLVEATLAAIRSHPNARRLVRVADAGTGSGAVALAVARHAPQAKIFATDASTEALAWAGRNRTRFGLLDRVVLLTGDLLEPIGEPLDVVAANLPYIPTDEYERLPPRSAPASLASPSTVVTPAWTSSAHSSTSSRTTSPTARSPCYSSWAAASPASSATG